MICMKQVEHDPLPLTVSSMHLKFAWRMSTKVLMEHAAHQQSGLRKQYSSMQSFTVLGVCARQQLGPDKCKHGIVQSFRQSHSPHTAQSGT